MIDHLEIKSTVSKKYSFSEPIDQQNDNDDQYIREWMIDHLEIESTVLHKESEEGKAQMQREGANKMGEAGGDHDHADNENNLKDP